MIEVTPELHLRCAVAKAKDPEGYAKLYAAFLGMWHGFGSGRKHDDQEMQNHAEWLSVWFLIVTVEAPLYSLDKQSDLWHYWYEGYY